jgi:putative ABC transport system permease protein
MPDWRQHIESRLGQQPLDAARLLEVREELAQHLDDFYHSLLAEGVPPAEAEQKTLNELQQGALGTELRRVLPAAPPSVPGESSRLRCLFNSVLLDLRYAMRQLRLAPGFALAALLSLGLGLGANTAIFELLDAVRMRTLPVENPQELASVKVVYHPHGRTGETRGVPDLTTGMYEAVRTQQQGFTDLAAWSLFTENLSRTADVRYGRVLLASGNLFSMLGVRSVAGRLIGAADDHRGCDAPIAVVSYGYWRNEMGGRASAVGEQVWVNRQAFTVAGVAAPSFFGLEVGRRFDIALPLCAEPLIQREDSVYNLARGWWLGAIGRLKPGWDFQRASAQLDAISPALMQTTMPPEYNSSQRAEYAELRLGVVPSATGYSRLRNTYDRPLWLLLGISGLVLLIACANLANLTLARASVRMREMAVRLALGASRTRLLRQLLSENLLLAGLGALIGLVLAQILSRALVPLLGSQNARIFLDLHVDWRVLGFSAALGLLTCVVFGLSPALQASRVAPAEAMKAGGRGVVAARSRFTFRRALAASQIALSLTLLVGALLFVRTFRNLITVDPGFDADRLTVVEADFSSLKLPAAEKLRYKQELSERIAAIPGVQSAARSRMEPVSGNRWNEEINVPAAGTTKAVAWFNEVSPGYFATLRTPLLAGREFNDRDTLAAPKVAIISRAFAMKLFHESAPIGKTFGVVQYGDKPDVLYQVVGVAEDQKYVDLRRDFEPIAFLSDMQAPGPDNDATLLVRSNLQPDVLIPQLRRELLSLHPALVLQFSQLKDDIAEQLVAERLMAMLAGFFGGFAILLAVVGLYGVIAYMVARRTTEIGIRVALGANRRGILRLVMTEVAAICAIGLCLGLLLTLAAAPAVRSLLFGLRPADPLTLLLAMAGMSGLAVLATLVPAIRAARLDPMAALREE